MSAKKYLKPYLAMVLFLTVIEVVWFFGVIGDFFSGEVGHLLAEEPKLFAAALFYLLYPIAIIAFCLNQSRSNKSAMLYGALLGFTVYFVYDLTNYVTLIDWSLKLMIVDVLWGTVVTAMTAMVGFKFIRRNEN